MRLSVLLQFMEQLTQKAELRPESPSSDVYINMFDQLLTVSQLQLAVFNIKMIYFWKNFLHVILWCLCTWAHASGLQDAGHPALSSSLIPLRWVFYWTWWVGGWQTPVILLFPSLPPQHWSFTGIQPCLTIYMGSRDPNSGPPACIASAFTHWTNSLGPCQRLK